MSTSDGPSGGPSTHLARDSAIVGGATVLTRLLGFVRDIMIAAALGAGPVADAFLVAFRLPNLFRRVLGEGGLNAPFVPHYLTIKAERGEAAAAGFAGGAASVFAIGLSLLVALTEIVAPWLVLAIAGGFRDAPVTFALAESYLRLALPFLSLTTMASLLAAILNAERRFAVAALAPALLNVVIITALVHNQWIGASPAQGAKTLALAVSLGGGAHLVMILIALWWGRPGLPRLNFRWTPDLTRFFVLAAPAVAAASTSQLVLLVATQIASSQAGAVSWLYYADRVFQLPLGFVAVAMGVVLLPEIASREAAGDDAGRRATVDRALAIGLSLALPAAAALVVLSEPIVAVLFERGKFGVIDRERTAMALAAFAIGLPFAVVAKVFAQVYFARQTPKLPLVAGLSSLVVAALTGNMLAHQAPATGAALAASLAFVTQSIILGAFLLRDRLWRPSAALSRRVGGAFAAMLIMAAACAWFATVFRGFLIDQQSTLLKWATLSGLCLGGAVLFFGFARLFGAFRLADLGDLRERNQA